MLDLNKIDLTLLSKKELLDKREAFQMKWNMLNTLRRNCIDMNKKEKIIEEMKYAERYVNLLDKKLSINEVFKHNSAVEYTSTGESVFERPSTYIGYTSHGYPIGEGCYWNRSGK